MKNNKINIDKTNLKNILQFCRPNEQIVLIKKYGLIDGKENSLQSIGKIYGLTRERIRQIENQGLLRLRRLINNEPKFLEIINTAKKILHQNGFILNEEDLLARMLNLNTGLKISEIKILLVSDYDIYYLKRNKLFNKCFFIEPLYETILNNIAQETLIILNKENKALDINYLIGILKEKFSNKLKINSLQEEKTLKNIILNIRDIAYLDNKIGLKTRKEVNPTTIKDKIEYILEKVNKPLHFEEITAKILEIFPEKNIKVSSVHNELVKNKDSFVNLGLGIYGLKKWGIGGGTLKEILIEIFEKYKRPMNIKEIVKEVMKKKVVSPASILITLQKDSDFKRIEKGIYYLNTDTKN